MSTAAQKALRDLAVDAAQLAYLHGVAAGANDPDERRLAAAGKAVDALDALTAALVLDARRLAIASLIAALVTEGSAQVKPEWRDWAVEVLQSAPDGDATGESFVDAAIARDK